MPPFEREEPMSPVSFVLAFRLSFLASSKSSEDGMQSLTKFRACCFVGEFDPPFDCSRHHAAQGMPGWVSRDPYVRCTRHAIKKGHQRSHRALWGQMYRQIHGGILCAWRLAWTGSGMKKKTGKKKKNNCMQDWWQLHLQNTEEFYCVSSKKLRPALSGENCMQLSLPARRV